MITFVGLRQKRYSYLIDDGCGDKKGKGAKKRVIKQRLKFEDSGDKKDKATKRCVINRKTEIC